MSMFSMCRTCKSDLCDGCTPQGFEMRKVKAELASLRSQLAAAEADRARLATKLSATESAWDTARERLSAATARADALVSRVAELEAMYQCADCQTTRAESVAARAQLDEAVRGLTAMRDHYVKRLDGKDKPTCTLCGSEEGTPHAADLGCGRAEALLALMARLASPGAAPAGEKP